MVCLKDGTSYPCPPPTGLNLGSIKLCPCADSLDPKREALFGVVLFSMTRAFDSYARPRCGSMVSSCLAVSLASAAASCLARSSSVMDWLLDPPTIWVVGDCETGPRRLNGVASAELVGEDELLTIR